MAQNAPPSQDIQDIQFKIHGKFNIFPEGKELKSLVSLLAVSSAKGLLFAGNQNAKELKVIKLCDIVESKNIGQDLKIRNVPLSGEPKALSCSCDGSMLAINYILNNTGFLQIYQVDSFVTPNLNTLYNLPVAPESNVFALQILWNPVIPNNIALILTDGSVAMYTLNSGGQYNKITLSKEHQVKSGCWSPKGKQIVFGFAEGKLQQFKPNLQPARVIACPSGILQGSFDCIAVHWLSTFQFAAIFLQRGPDMSPSLFIVNAPKAGQPSYINYLDICYSAPGPRIQQLTFTHIAQWNILLVTSANGVEIGILGTRESGETPTWMQYTLLDEARIEMPLTDTKDETYPVGFAYDTASSHQVAMGEKKLPVMPMIHVLSTHGHLVSFDFLNLAPNAVDVCSPPPPLNDISGQFKSLKESLGTGQAQGGESLLRQSLNENVSADMGPSAGKGFGDTTFTVGPNMVTSTPSIKDKPVPLFGAQVAAVKPTTGFGFPSNTVAPSAATAATNTADSKPATGFGFGASNTTVTPTSAASFVQPYGNITTGTTFNNFAGTTGFGGAKPKDSVNQQSAAASQSTIQTSNAIKNDEVNKPLYTVPSTFTPPPTTTVQQTIKQDTRPLKTTTSTILNLNTLEIDELVKSLIIVQLSSFETELRQVQNQTKKLFENIGSPDEIKPYTKQLNDLQEIIEEADDHEFEQDVQSLRHFMNESYAMLAECRTKLDLYNNPDLTRLSTISNADPINRRQLAKLQAYVASNQTQLSQLNQLIDAQWSQYQDVIRRNSKSQMHIPCLDGIYQRMSKLKDLLSKQRTKMNYIKSKLKQKGLNYKSPNDVNVTSVAVGALTKNQSTIESLADSILSMSLSQVVSQTHAKLSEDKLNAIREYTRRQQQITIIKPKRPDRVGLKSEVILETKLQTEKKQKEMAKQRQQQQQQQQQLQQQQQQQIRQQQQQYQQQQNLKAAKAQQQAAFQIHLQHQQHQQLPKPQATIQSTQHQKQPILAKPTASKPSMTAQPLTFKTPTSSTAGALSFGGNSSFVKTSTSAIKSDDIPKPLTASTPFQQFGMPTSSSSAGLSFVQPKPLTSNAPTESKGNAPTNTPISFAAKVIGGNDAKAFTSLGNMSANAMAPPGFVASTSTSTTANQGFTAFSGNKSSTQERDVKKSQDVNKPFDFSSSTASSSSSVPTSTPAFGGFSATAKSSTLTVSTSGAFTTPVFVSASNATTTNPFGGISSASTTPFATSFSTASSTTPAAATMTTTKTVATTSTTVPLNLTASKTEGTQASSTATIATSTSASLNNPDMVNSTVISTKSSVAPNVTITSSGIPEPKTAVVAPTSTNPPTSAASSDSTNSPFDSLNICKPNTKEAGDSAKPFSGFGATTSTATVGAFSFATASGAGDGATSFFGSTPEATASSGFSFGDTVTSSTTENVFGRPTALEEGAKSTATTIVTTTSIKTTSSVGTTVASTSTTTVAGAVTTAASSFGTTPITGTSAESAFGSLSLSSTTVPNTAATTTATVTTASGNIFGGGSSSVFGLSAVTSTAAATSTTTSIFGGGAAAATSGPSLFGSTAPATAAAATPGTGSIFGATSVATPHSSGSIFGGIPKPDQSVFGSTSNPPQPAGTGIFAAAAATTKPPPATGASIFGGGSTTGFGAPSAASGGSIFGGGGNASAATSPFAPPAPAAANTASSIFSAAAAATKPMEGGNSFGSPTQQSAAAGGSIFGKSTFGQTAAPQSTGSIFSGATSQSPTAGGFGSSGGSIFGGSTSANNSASGGSIFGGAAAATAPAFGSSATSPGFGSFSQASATPVFGSSNTGGFGAPAATGFGSPQQQSAFTKSVFGGPATFGSNPQPAFGTQPTFGGAPTFGSPKGFGSFAATSPTVTTGFGAAAAAAPGGNIFETLGSQDTSLSFGNLAHTTQPLQQKPTFGGSSFTSYRS